MTEWKLVPVEPTPAMLQDGAQHCGMGMFGTDDEASKVYAAMLAAAPADPTAEYTAEQARDCQSWRGMDGATAWHLIDRHAAGWSDIGRMMDAWLAANREQPNAEASGCLRAPMPEDAPRTAAGSPLERPVGPVAGA